MLRRTASDPSRRRPWCSAIDQCSGWDWSCRGWSSRLSRFDATQSSSQRVFSLCIVWPFRPNSWPSPPTVCLCRRWATLWWTVCPWTQQCCTFLVINWFLAFNFYALRGAFCKNRVSEIQTYYVVWQRWVSNVCMIIFSHTLFWNSIYRERRCVISMFVSYFFRTPLSHSRACMSRPLLVWRRASMCLRWCTDSLNMRPLYKKEHFRKSLKKCKEMFSNSYYLCHNCLPQNRRDTCTWTWSSPWARSCTRPRSCTACCSSPS